MVNIIISDFSSRPIVKWFAELLSHQLKNLVRYCDCHPV